jgi:hypothetical protein
MQIQAWSLLHSIEESGYPIEEDETTISALRNQVGKGELSHVKRTGCFADLGTRRKNGGKQLRVLLKPSPAILSLRLTEDRFFGNRLNDGETSSWAQAGARSIWEKSKPKFN